MRLVYGAAPPGGLGEEFKAHRDALTEMGRKATAHALERARQEGVEAKVDVVSAKPAEALLRVADECDATVIVVGTSGESPIKGAMLGSTPAQAAPAQHPPGALRSRRGLEPTSAQAMSAGLRTSSSVFRSAAVPAASRLACGSLTDSSRDSDARPTVEVRSPR